MKKKINYWIIYFVLTVGTAFLFDSGVLAGHTEDNSLSNGEMGSIKLSGNLHTVHVKGGSLTIRYKVRKQ
jgi:hypothetical protein